MGFSLKTSFFLMLRNTSEWRGIQIIHRATQVSSADPSCQTAANPSARICARRVLVNQDECRQSHCPASPVNKGVRFFRERFAYIGLHQMTTKPLSTRARRRKASMIFHQRLAARRQAWEDKAQAGTPRATRALREVCPAVFKALGQGGLDWFALPHSVRRELCGLMGAFVLYEISVARFAKILAPKPAWARTLTRMTRYITEYIRKNPSVIERIT